MAEPSVGEDFVSTRLRNGDQRREKQIESMKEELNNLRNKKNKSKANEARIKQLEAQLHESPESESSIMSEEGVHTDSQQAMVDPDPRGSQDQSAGPDDDVPQTANEGNEQQESAHPVATSKPPSASLLQDEGGGVAVFYTKCASFPGYTRIVSCYGPQHAAIYEFGDSKVHKEKELEGLPFISSKDRTVLDIREGGRQVYGYHNIKKITHAVILRPDPNKKTRTRPRPTKTEPGKRSRSVTGPSFPPTLIHVVWDGVSNDHLKLLKLMDGTSWNTRGAIMNKIKRKDRVQLQHQIRCVATQQDLEYSQNLRTEGTLDQERPKTFWPDEGKGSEPETARSRKVPSGETKMDRNDKPCSDQKGPEESSDASVHRTEKRRRSHDSETQGADTPKKPKYIPKPKNGLIDRHIYMADMMTFYKLDRTLLDNDGKTDEQIKRDTQKYRDGVKDIEDGWEEYKKNMLDQGYTELQ